MCRMADKANGMVLELLKDAFEDAKIPISFYKGKKPSTNVVLVLPKYMLVQMIVCYNLGNTMKDCKNAKNARHIG